MPLVLNVLLPCFFLYVMILGFYRVYKLLNEKITGSQTLLQVLLYSFLLIAVNILIFFGGLLLLFEVYRYLS